MGLDKTLLVHIFTRTKQAPIGSSPTVVNINVVKDTVVATMHLCVYVRQKKTLVTSTLLKVSVQVPVPISSSSTT